MANARTFSASRDPSPRQSLARGAKGAQHLRAVESLSLTMVAKTHDGLTIVTDYHRFPNERIHNDVITACRPRCVDTGPLTSSLGPSIDSVEHLYEQIAERFGISGNQCGMPAGTHMTSPLPN